MLKKFSRGLLLCSGMVSGATAGNLFYMERFSAGSAMLALTATFLFFALADFTARGSGGEEISDALAEQRRITGELALLLADCAADRYKYIGRTMPGTVAELNKLEDGLMPLLNSLGVDRAERERILQEIEKLRTRSRQDEGRRALSGIR